jgi:hypothetical protein
MVNIARPNRYTATPFSKYYHCKTNNLREVWAYLWTNWYAAGKWESWARSSYEHAIPRKRTTMLVEALWRNFKRMVLHHYNRPRVDFATYMLVTQGVAPYRVRFNRTIRNPRDGRAKAYMESRSRSSAHGLHFANARPMVHIIRTSSSGLLMRNTEVPFVPLVQASRPGSPPSQRDWWTTVIRWHTPPFYDIRELLPEGERETAPSPAALGPRYWTGQVSAPSQHSLPLTGVTKFGKWTLADLI